MLGLFKNKKIKDKRINRYATVPADVIKEMWNTYEKYNLSVDPDTFMDGMRIDLQEIVDKKIKTPVIDKYVAGKYAEKYIGEESVDTAKEIAGDFALYFCKNYAMMFEKNSYVTVMLGLVALETCKNITEDASRMIIDDLEKCRVEYFRQTKPQMDVSFDTFAKDKSKTETFDAAIKDFYKANVYKGNQILAVESAYSILNLEYQLMSMAKFEYMKKYFHQLALDTKQITEKPENDVVLYMLDKFISDEKYVKTAMETSDENIVKENMLILAPSAYIFNEKYKDEIIFVYKEIFTAIKNVYLKNYYSENSIDKYDVKYDYLYNKNMDNIQGALCVLIIRIYFVYINYFDNDGKYRENKLEKMKRWNDKKVIAWDENGNFHDFKINNIVSDYKQFILDNFGLPSDCEKIRTSVHGGVPSTNSIFLNHILFECAGRCLIGSNLQKDSFFGWCYGLYNKETAHWEF